MSIAPCVSAGLREARNLNPEARFFINAPIFFEGFP